MGTVATPPLTSRSSSWFISGSLLIRRGPSHRTRSATSGLEGFRQDFCRMARAAAGPVENLLSAGDPRGNDLCALASVLDRRKQSLPPDGNREVVVLSLKAERGRHPAAAGIDLLHAEARNQAQGLEGRTSSHQCLLVAVAVDEDAPLGRPKSACQIPAPP